MEPQIRFCTSADGTRIAYTVYGSGPPLLYVDTGTGSIEATFAFPERRAYFDAFAERLRLVMFDRRGAGASAREVDDLTPEAEAGDIAAVADAAGLRDFTLFADASPGVCITYATSPHSRLNSLIFWTLGEAWTESEMRSQLQDAALRIRNDWSLYRRLLAGRLAPDGPVSLQRSLSKAFKDSVTADMAARRLGNRLALADLDALLPRVRVPVLMLGLASEERQATVHLASLLPQCQLGFVPGGGATVHPDRAPVVEAVFEFMGVAEPASPATISTHAAGTAVILFADIADSTALTEQLGDAAFRDRARALDTSLRSIISAAGGTTIDAKTLGDGVLATFPAASQAIDAALRCGAAGDGQGLPLHVGLHAGDVIREDNNVYGGAVNIASRISALAAPGEVLVSDIVRGLARTSAAVTFEDRGEHALKGVAEPQRVFAVRKDSM